jgi:MFS family permease
MSAATTASSGLGRRRWLILGVIGLAQLMVVLDLTIMNIALPTAQRALHFTTVDRQWVVTAYALAFGSLLLLGGRLADLLGRKVTFLIGLVGFAGVSAIGGASVNFAMLVTARACQGAFAALLVPSALSLLITTFTEQKERARAFGVFGAIAVAGGAVGLLLGGALTEYLSWRWTLYVNLFFAGVAFVGGALLLPRQRPQGRPVLDRRPPDLRQVGRQADLAPSRCLCLGLIFLGVSNAGAPAPFKRRQASTTALRATGRNQ